MKAEDPEDGSTGWYLRNSSMHPAEQLGALQMGVVVTEERIRAAYRPGGST